MTTPVWDQATAKLARPGRASTSSNGIAFVFSGQGNQWLGMGRDLIEYESAARETLREADGVLRELADWSLLVELNATSADSRLADPAVLQPVLVAVQLALVRVLAERGIVPSACVGHSLGEVAAAAAAGALDLAGALELAMLRGTLMRKAVDTGLTALLGVSAQDATDLIARHGGAADVAAWNAPASTLIAGSSTTIEAVVRELATTERFCRLLPGTVAFHSRFLDPIRAEMADAVRHIAAGPTTCALYSSVTGGPLDPVDVTATHWAANLREPVRFAQAIDALLDAGYRTFVEVGPHPTLAPSISDCSASRGVSPTVVPTLRRGEPDHECLDQTVTGLRRSSSRAGRIRFWQAVFMPVTGARGAEIAEPAYGARLVLDVDGLLAAGTGTRQRLLTDHVRAEAARVLRMPVEKVHEDQPVNSLGLDSIMGMELRRRLETDFGVDINVVRLLRGATCRRIAVELSESLIERAHGPAAGNLDDPEDIERLLADIDALPQEEVESLLSRMAGEAAERS